jgi:cystathionine gamma-synthase
MAVDPPTPATPVPAPDPTLSPATVAVTAGRPAHVPDAPLNTPITMAST